MLEKNILEKLDFFIFVHMNVQNFWHIFCIQYLRRLWYAKVFNEPLAAIEQYRISFNRNTMVVNDHFIREGQLSP